LPRQSNDDGVTECGLYCAPVQDFHKIRAWKRGTRLAIAVRALLATFPRRGYGRLKDQMIRAAESMPDNIAEGCGTQTIPDFVRFLDSSIKSANELESQLDRSFGYRLMERRKWLLFTTEVQTIRKMTVGLRKVVLRGGLPDEEILLSKHPSENRNNGGTGSKLETADGQR
jgi:four helix bundle protein